MLLKREEEYRRRREKRGERGGGGRRVTLEPLHENPSLLRAIHGSSTFRAVFYRMGVALDATTL